MMIQEFQKRTGYLPTAEEYKAIEDMYYNTDMDKDEFCKYWLEYNYSKVKAQNEKNEIRRRLVTIKDDIKKAFDNSKFSWDLYEAYIKARFSEEVCEMVKKDAMDYRDQYRRLKSEEQLLNAMMNA